MNKRPVPPPRYEPQSRPKVLQPKMAGNQPSHVGPRRQQPVAPPVFKPQPVPRVLQRQVAREPQPAKSAVSRVPIAPPAYRPQTLPKVLQLKRATVQPERKGSQLRYPTAPPVYRPQPTPKVLQAKMANVRPATAPPTMNAGIAPSHAPKPGFGRTVIQRQIATRLELRGVELEQTADAYQRSKNDPDRGRGIKPLLSIKIKNSTSRLHVHLAPDHLIRQMTGWNIKRSGGGYDYAADLQTSMVLDAEDRALFDTYAPRWKDQGAYPGDITWNGRTAEEEEMITQERLRIRREGYAVRLEGQLDRYVKTETNRESSITETYVFTCTRARKKKGETAAGYKRFIEDNKPLPVVEDVTITAHVFGKPGEYESMYKVKCVYNKGQYLAKMDAVKGQLEEFGKKLKVVGEPEVTCDWDEKAALIRQARVAHIAAIRAGTEDAAVAANF